MYTTFEFLFALVLIALYLFPLPQTKLAALVAQVFLTEDDEEVDAPGAPPVPPNPGPSGEFDDVEF